MDVWWTKGKDAVVWYLLGSSGITFAQDKLNNRRGNLIFAAGASVIRMMTFV